MMEVRFSGSERFFAAYLAFLPQSENPEGIQGPLHNVVIMWILNNKMDFFSFPVSLLLHVPEVLSFKLYSL